MVQQRPTQAHKSGFVRMLAMAALFVMLTVVGLEGAARMFLPDQVATWRRPLWGNQPDIQEIYFYTPGALRNAATYPTYKPNSDIRLQAYFPDQSGSLTREFDCAFHSDKLGYVSNDGDYEDSEILVLGDSFTVGNGGCGWVSRLAPDVRSRVYAAAHPGYGVSHWRAVLADLEKIKKPAKILIVMITDDVVRSGWTYEHATLDCLDLKKPCEGQIIMPLTDKLEDAVAARSLHYKPNDLKSAIKYYFPASIQLLRMMFRTKAVPAGIVDESIADLKAMASRYDLKLLWVTEKAESSGPTASTKRLASQLSGIDTTRCRIPPRDFMPRDYHPNAKGYAVLKGCVEKIVQSW